MYDPDNPPNPIFQLFGTIACVIIGVPFLLMSGLPSDARVHHVGRPA